MKQWFIINPENRIYSIQAMDQFEAIHKAKRIDGHIYETNRYQIIKPKTNGNKN